MAESDPNLWLAITTVIGSVGGYLAKAWDASKKKQEGITKELERIGADLIDERRQDAIVERAEKNRYRSENDALREQLWRWKSEHTELAVENDALRVANEELKQRCARLNKDVDRYQLELSQTADIRPPKDTDDTGPQQAQKKKKS